MKAYIEFIGNEDRPPKFGERFEDDNGNIALACYDHEEIRRIVTRHEIEVPENATLFQYQTNNGKLYHFYREEGICSYGHILIPRPKKKVKKWIYEFTCQGVVWRSVAPLSEEEYGKQPMTGHKIPETEIEVEE